VKPPLSFRLVHLFLVMVLLACGLSAQAAKPPVFDCYKALDLAKARPALSREVVVAIDETTVFSADLVHSFTEKTLKTLEPGDRVQILVFSAASARHYLRELLTIELDQVPTDSGLRELPIRRAQELTQCVTLQRLQKTRAIEGVLRAGAAAGTSNIPASEILGALRDIGTRFAASEAPRRLLVLASDGLQHSAQVTFYDQRAIRKLDAQRELQVVRGKGLLANLAGVRVVFFGGGLAPPEAGFREQAELLGLESFWQLYVREAGGQLVAFGKPIPLVDFR
jgi:hypothetical protein